MPSVPSERPEVVAPAALVSADELAYRRVLRALRRRRRYRYVQPQVRREDTGYVVLSPCCSRNVDPAGGVIPIAWIERMPDGWRLNRRDHATGHWVSAAEGALPRVLDLLSTDPERVFWP
jgi:hypothetical protein